MTNDWGKPSSDWQQGARQEPTFKHDFGGFVFHVALVALVGSVAFYTWNTFGPQPVIRIQVEQIK